MIPALHEKEEVMIGGGGEVRRQLPPRSRPMIDNRLPTFPGRPVHGPKLDSPAGKSMLDPILYGNRAVEPKWNGWRLMPEFLLRGGRAQTARIALSLPAPQSRARNPHLDKAPLRLRR